MSKRKLPTSYTSVRRQVRAQVDADIRFIEGRDACESSDELADEHLHNAHVDVHVPVFHRPVADTDDSNEFDNIDSSPNMCESQNQSLINSVIDFDDGHWVDSETDTDDDEEQLPDSDYIRGRVNEWCNVRNVNHASITELMHILQPCFAALPRDARALLHTPRSCEIKHLKSGGEYCHIGLAKGLRELFQKVPAPQTECLELQFNVDGVPLFKSSNSCLWPILCKLKDPHYMEPIVVGIYHGNEKPGDASEFLSDFINEMTQLTENGITVADQLYTVKVHSFVCDAPARSFLKGIKGHSGYAACEKCTEHGEYVGKVIYPGTAAPLRTDISLDEMSDEDHHCRPCPLKPLSVGCVTQFGLDYMHLVCLGVVRRLLLYWKGSIGPLGVRLGSRAVNELSQKLISLCSYIPSEFARRPRSVLEVLRWKATEFRQFLLYTGPVILGEFLSRKVYHHFLLLSVGIRILASRQLALDFCDYANELLVLFVSKAEKLYGKDIYVYNVHCLIHLAGDVRNLGILDDFSSFPFENKLGQLKKLIRKPQFPIQQIVYRLAERQHVSCREVIGHPVVKNEHNTGPLLAAYRNYRQYRCVHTEKFTISLSVGNNCIVVTDGSAALVRNILDDNGTIVLLCQHFATTSDAFDYPLLSSRLGIYKVSDKMTDIFPLPFSSVSQKCALLPMKHSFVVLPLLH